MDPKRSHRQEHKHHRHRDDREDDEDEPIDEEPDIDGFRRQLDEPEAPAHGGESSTVMSGWVGSGVDSVGQGQ